MEVCWGPMLAAFSMTLDQSDDKVAIAQCLQGFRHAVHITAVMGMQTQRDAFVTTVAKFTNLHCAADMRQKNVDAVKVFFFFHFFPCRWILRHCFDKKKEMNSLSLIEQIK